MDPSYDVIIQDVCTLLKSCHQFFYDVWDPYYGFLKRKPPYIELHAQPLWDPRILVIHMLLHKWPDAIIQWIQIAALRRPYVITERFLPARGFLLLLSNREKYDKYFQFHDPFKKLFSYSIVQRMMKE